MSIFVDTGAFVAYRNKRDKYHNEADILLRKTLKGEFGKIYTSDYVYDESITLALSRTSKVQVMMDISKTILSPRIEMIFVDKSLFDKARSILSKYLNKKLSFTDASSIAIIEEYKIESLISFDSHFDGIVKRLKGVG